MEITVTSYFLLCLIPFVLILLAMKVHDGEVTVGTLLVAVAFSVVPILNLFMILCALGTLGAYILEHPIMDKRLF